MLAPRLSPAKETSDAEAPAEEGEEAVGATSEDEELIMSLFDAASVRPVTVQQTLGSAVIWDPPASGKNRLERLQRKQRRRHRSVQRVIGAHRQHSLGRQTAKEVLRAEPASPAGGAAAASEARPDELSQSQSAYSHLTSTTHFSHRPPLLVLPFELDLSYDKPPGPFRNSGALGRVERLAYNWS